jgi:hypothetical protein
MKTLQIQIEGLLSSVQIELPVSVSDASSAAVWDDATMTDEDVRSQLDDTIRTRDLETMMVERYTDADKINRDRFKEHSQNVSTRLDAESKRLVELPHDHPLQKTLYESLRTLRDEMPSSDIVERKHIHDDERRSRHAKINAELDACKLDLRAIVACTFETEERSIAELQNLCSSYEDEIRNLTHRKQDEREHMLQYSDPMRAARRQYKDTWKRTSELLATQQALLSEMEQRVDCSVTEDGLCLLQVEHHTLLDRYAEQIERAKQLLAQCTQRIADYLRYEHDDRDRDELQRRRDTFIDVTFNPDCAQCQTNPIRREVLLIDERLRHIDDEKEARDFAKSRKKESENQIIVVTEQLQHTCGLHDFETKGWPTRHSEYVAKLRDCHRLRDQTRTCGDLRDSLNSTLEEWKQSDSRACYKRYKTAMLTHTATADALLRVVETRTQIATFVENAQATAHNATLRERMTSLTLLLAEPEDEIDLEHGRYVDHLAKLESLTREHERVVLNNARHQSQQETRAMIQSDLDKLQQQWTESVSNQRYIDYKRAQATHTNTVKKQHQLEEIRDQRLTHAHNLHVRTHNTRVHASIADGRAALQAHETMSYDEYDQNVLICAQVQPKREELIRIDAQRSRLEHELSLLGVSSVCCDEFDDADLDSTLVKWNDEKTSCDALQAACTRLRSNWETFIAQRLKVGQRNVKIHTIEQDIRAFELSIDMLSEKGVVARWFDRALSMIQTAVNSFAFPLLCKNLAFTSHGDKISIGFASDVGETSIPIFGGMESVVVDLAIQMALAELTRSVRCNLFIVDEAFFVMDQQNRMQVPRLLHELQQKYHHVFVISHDSFIHDVIHQEIQIRTNSNQRKTIQITGAACL